LRSAIASAAVSFFSVSMLTLSLCEFLTGMRTQVGETRMFGSPMIFLVSSIIFVSSVV
jgi:hypothetical protein